MYGTEGTKSQPSRSMDSILDNLQEAHRLVQVIHNELGIPQADDKQVQEAPPPNLLNRVSMAGDSLRYLLDRIRQVLEVVERV